MPKNNKDFTKELKAEFEKGNLKPSQLKRSKSTETLSVPKEIPLTKSKSAENLPLAHPSLNEQVKQLKQDLVFANNTAQTYLKNLQKTTADLTNAQEKIKELKATNNQLIDQNNELRLQALKQDDQIRGHNKEMNQAANQFNQLEDQKNSYRVQNGMLLREKSQLEQQLKQAQEQIQKLYQLKGLPTNPPPTAINWTNLLITCLLMTGVIYLIWPRERTLYRKENKF